VLRQASKVRLDRKALLVPLVLLVLLGLLGLPVRMVQLQTSRPPIYPALNATTTPH
jgi:hypothetical protein